jgi:hypothetical protein
MESIRTPSLPVPRSRRTHFHLNFIRICIILRATAKGNLFNKKSTISAIVQAKMEILLCIATPAASPPDE